MKYQMLCREIAVRQGVPLLSFRGAGWPERGPVRLRRRLCVCVGVLTGRQWIAVDCYDHFDGELMRRYFRDLMVPSIPNPDGTPCLCVVLAALTCGAELEPLQDIYPRVEKGPEEDPEHSDYSVRPLARRPRAG
jgi:hypothetical protein